MLKGISIHLVSAYGRQYTSAEQVINDWKADKDFKILAGPYTSIRDRTALIEDYGRILVRYDQLRKLIDVTEIQ